jgi:hypothetical protein
VKTDGSILIDTKIIDGGMEKGFELIKDEMSSVGITAKKVGEQIQLSFAKMDVSKPIANAVSKVEQLERQLSSVTSDFELSVSDGDDKAAERLANKRIAIYDRLEAAREKLSIEIAAAVQREAEAEEKASQKAIRAAEKEAEAKKRIAEKQFRDLSKPARRFGTRLREIVSGALFFNLMSAGLRELTSHFGTALKANNEFSASFAQLKGALLTAFQPIYELVLPALIQLMRVLTAVVQVIGGFFSSITGKSTSQMAKNAKALNKQAAAIGGVGNAAEEASKQLAGFDEINRLESLENSIGGFGGGAGMDEITPNFDPIEITEDLERILALVGAIGAGILAWKIASMFTDSLSIAAGLAMAVGGAVYYAYNWADAFANGINWKNLSGILLSTTAIVAGLAVAFGTTGAAVGLLITGIGMVVLALYEWIKTGELSTEACSTLVLGIMAIGAAISLFTGSWIPLLVAGVASAVVLIAKNWDQLVACAKQMLANIREYMSVTFADGFIHGIATMIEDAIAWLWNIFVDFINSVIENWNSIWGGINQYHTTGTISPRSSMASYSRTPPVPQLAKGAVLPANKPFLAMVGDQTNGTNIEAPLETIKQALSEVMAQQGWDVNVEFRGELAALARILAPVITKEQRNVSRARGV